jgi:hypothetical protein
MVMVRWHLPIILHQKSSKKNGIYFYRIEKD